MSRLLPLVVLAVSAAAAEPDAVVHVTLRAPGYTAANAPAFARVKFNKAAPLCMISDDMSLGDFCSTWALFNGYPHAGTTHDRKYPRGDLLLDQAVRDIPAGYYDGDSDLDGAVDGVHDPLVFSDGAGGVRRFACSSAVFAYSDGNYLQISPEDVRSMMRTGWSCTFHDVDGADTKDAESVAARLGPISARWESKTGQPLKIMTEPNGNHVYLDACRISDEICWSIFQNSASGYPANSILIDDWTDRAAGIPSSFESKPQGGFARIWAQGSESSFSNAVNAVIASGAGTKFILGGTHGVGDAFKGLFANEIRNSDLFWVASVDEIWEYYWLYHNASIENLAYDSSTQVLAFDVRLPACPKHRFREVTVNLPGLAGASDFAFEGAVTAGAAQNADGVTLNVGAEEHVLADIDELLALHEEYMANPCLARDAQYLIDLLAPGPEKDARQARLDEEWRYSWVVKSTTGETLFSGRCNEPTNISYAVPLLFLHGTDLYRLDPDRYPGKWFPQCGGSFSLDDANPSFATNWLYRVNEGYGIGWSGVVLFAEGEDLLPAARVDDPATAGLSMQAAARPEPGADVPLGHLGPGRYKFGYKYQRPSGTGHSTWAVVTNGAAAWSASNNKNEASTTILSSEFELPRGADAAFRLTPNSGSLCELVDCVWIKRTGDVDTSPALGAVAVSATEDAATLSVRVDSLGLDCASATLTVALGGETRTLDLSATGTFEFAFSGLDPATDYPWTAMLVSDGGEDSASGTATTAVHLPAVALGPATAAAEDGRADVALSVSLTLRAASATLALLLDGATNAVWTETASGTLSRSVTVRPGTAHAFAFVAEADGETAVAAGSFAVYAASDWFDVRWTADGYPEGAAWDSDPAAQAASGGAWTRPAGDASALADGRLSFSITNAADALVFTPTRASSNGVDLVVEGVVDALAGRPPEPADPPLAGLCFASGGVCVWANGAWRGAAPATPASEGLAWRAEFDFSSSNAPLVRYRAGGAALTVDGAEWLPVALAGADRATRVAFLGEGALGNFRGYHRALVSDPVEIPAPVFAADGALAVSGSTFIVSLVGTDAGFWYTAFAAGALDGEFVSEAASVRGTGGVLPLSVDADPQTHPTRFVRVVVSRDPCESAGVALSAFLAR